MNFLFLTKHGLSQNKTVLIKNLLNLGHNVTIKKPDDTIQGLQITSTYVDDKYIIAEKDFN